jgi:DNA-directed RNA polymerase subunit N (RpoN/RPB10)
MYPPVVCHCGRSIGPLYMIYREMRKDRLIAHNKDHIAPWLLQITSDSPIETGDILDDLGLDLDCCRILCMQRPLFIDVV